MRRPTPHGASRYRPVLEHQAIMKLFRSTSSTPAPVRQSLVTVRTSAPPPTTPTGYTVPENLAVATFGAGCFWGVEEAFRQIEGVVSTAVGFEGGTLENPSYKDVCTGRTGHAEVVQVIYDPAVVAYEGLLEIFWTHHNPTTKNRQGWDIGTQYRSAIFVHNDEQETIARRSLEELDRSGQFSRPIVTEIAPAGTFYHAEGYHQQYLAQRGMGSCSI
jgi:peptide-methionine (S)-S-oxide reductase